MAESVERNKTRRENERERAEPRTRWFSLPTWNFKKKKKEECFKKRKRSRRRRRNDVEKEEKRQRKDKLSGGCIISTLLDKPGGTDTPHAFPCGLTLSLSLSVSLRVYLAIYLSTVSSYLLYIYSTSIYLVVYKLNIRWCTFSVVSRGWPSLCTDPSSCNSRT